MVRWKLTSCMTPILIWLDFMQRWLVKSCTSIKQSSRMIHYIMQHAKANCWILVRCEDVAADTDVLLAIHAMQSKQNLITNKINVTNLGWTYAVESKFMVWTTINLCPSCDVDCYLIQEHTVNLPSMSDAADQIHASISNFHQAQHLHGDEMTRNTYANRYGQKWAGQVWNQYMVES